jgi:fucose permease
LASSLLASAAAMALMPSAPQLPILLALSTFLGIALASINVGGNALLAMIHGEGVRPFISVLHFAFGLGGGLAPTLVAQLESRADFLHLTYWLMALAIIPVALMTLFSPSPAVGERKRIDSPAAPATPSLMIALFAALAFLQIGAEATAMGWFFSYAVDRGMNGQTAAYLNSGFWWAFTLGRLATIWMSFKFNAVPLIVVSLSIALLIPLGLLVIAPTPVVLWLGAIGLGLAVAPVFPTVFGLAERMLGLSGKITGLILVGSSAGSMFWPWLTGQFFKSHGPQVMALVVALNLLGALATVAILNLLPSRARCEIRSV